MEMIVPILDSFIFKFMIFNVVWKKEEVYAAIEERSMRKQLNVHSS